MKGDLSWLVLVLLYTCSFLFIGVYTKTKELKVKKVIASKDNKQSEIKNDTGLLIKKGTLNDLDFERKQGANSLMLGNTTLRIRKKLENWRKTDKDGTQPSYKGNLLPTNTTQMRDEDIKISRGDKAEILSNKTNGKQKNNKQNDTRHLRTKLKSLKHKNLTDQAVKIRAKKLLVSFFDSELDDTENDKHSRVESTHRINKTNGTKEHDTKEHDTKEHDTKEHDRKEHDTKEHRTKEHDTKQHDTKEHDTKQHDRKEHDTKQHDTKEHDRKEHDRKEHDTKQHDTKEHDRKEHDRKEHDTKQHDTKEHDRKEHDRKEHDTKQHDTKEHDRKEHDTKQHDTKEHDRKEHDTKQHDTKEHRTKEHDTKEHETKENETKEHDTKEHETKEHDTKEYKMKNFNPTKNATGSQLINKRTKILYTIGAPQAVSSSLKQNNQVMETVLPSGPGAERPQHVQVSNQPTHVMFKPVHKYYPAIHRYMTQPIHRFLNKPVNFRDTQVGQTRDQAVVTQANQAEVTQADIPQAFQPSVPQAPQVAVTQAIQPGVKQAVQAMPQNVLPGARLVSAPRPAQGIEVQPGSLRMFSQITPGIQPVLFHQNRMSPTGYGPCTTNPCKNSGVCNSVNEQVICICRPGYRGKFCELINNCHPNPCHNFASCTELDRDFECTCRKGYRGKRCEVENKCEPNPCVNGGTCSEMDDDYVCTCREGFLGHSCEAESKCNPINPCKNGGSCQEARDTYRCVCRDGFGGFNCEARVIRDHCKPNPCYHGGFCTITGTSTGNYTCSCPPGWKGFTCVEKVDNWGNAAGPSICESVNPCLFGGTCTPGSYYDYTCTCPPHRGGVHCEHSLIKEKATSCIHCHAFARCLNNHCECKDGYKGDGRNCVPVPQFCHPNPCYNGGTCREPISKHTSSTSSDGKQWWCECPAGYSGANCQEMDLCHIHPCQNGGSCMSNEGQAKCLCTTPYRGRYCEEKDVCHLNPCRNGGTCKAVDGVATCVCSEEYEGMLCDHWRCYQCDVNARCTGGNCVCKNGYSGDGRTCRKNIPKISPVMHKPAPTVHSKLSVYKFCDSNPCASGATCLEALQTYFCQCPDNKYGKQCEQTTKVPNDLCSKCNIDATCRDGKCVCNEGFTGSGFNCKKTQEISEEQIADNSHKTDSSCDFCPENGQCLNDICVCPPGYQNNKRSCVAIDDSVKYKMKPMALGIQYVGTTRNRMPIGQWKEDSVVDEYRSLGCWSDTKEWRNPIMRAMEVLEGLHPSLNDNYKKRKNPITKCASAAKAYGYKIFAIQNGGQCFSGTDAEKSYTTYGPSTQCRFGVGGNLSNDVYKLS